MFSSTRASQQAGGGGLALGGGGPFPLAWGNYISRFDFVGQSEVAAVVRGGGWGVWRGNLWDAVGGRRLEARLGTAPPHSTPPSQPTTRKNPRRI